MAFSLFNIGKSKEPVKNQVVEVPLAQIVPNRYQPRQVFDQTAIQELAQTIDEHGLLQPIILREYETGKYEIIAGERRFRAMSLLDWTKAPAIVEKMNDQETASLALIENLQRSQLRRGPGLSTVDGTQQADPVGPGQGDGEEPVLCR